MRRVPALSVLLAVLAAHPSFGASAVPTASASIWEIVGIPDPMGLIMMAGALALVGVVAGLLLRHQGETLKKALFALIVVPVVFSTGYLVAASVYLNMLSETGGPVHWHADYYVWACGKEYDLINASGFDDKVGTDRVHSHNGHRVHVEGVLLRRSEASLGNFFEVVGGHFDNSSLTLPTDNGTFTWKDGDLCNGKSARWYVFVDGKLIEDAPDYIVSPYTTVPPGDRIKLVFDERRPEELNPDLGGPP